jgi:Fe-S-cluster containining protein
MKLKDQPQGSDRLMTWDDTFCFECHSGIDCFNSCCANVTIFLTPVDVMRMRKALGISSEDFLEKHTHRLISQKTGLPAVVLKMGENERKACSFVTEKGCSIYEDRPYTCRLYPLDTANGVEYKLIVSSESCHGLRESKEWTVEKWRSEQGLRYYDDPDHNLKDVMAADEVWEQQIADPRAQDMFLMALYDPDRFREFIFKSSFLKKFKIDDDILEKIREDDLALLYFGTQWLRFVFFGQKGFLKIDRDYLEKKKHEVLSAQRQEK